jgi:hypothetical protein
LSITKPAEEQKYDKTQAQRNGTKDKHKRMYIAKTTKQIEI